MVSSAGLKSLMVHELQRTYVICMHMLDCLVWHLQEARTDAHRLCGLHAQFQQKMYYDLKQHPDTPKDIVNCNLRLKQCINAVAQMLNHTLFHLVLVMSTCAVASSLGLA